MVLPIKDNTFNCVLSLAIRRPAVRRQRPLDCGAAGAFPVLPLPLLFFYVLIQYSRDYYNEVARCLQDQSVNIVRVDIVRVD